MLFNDTFNEFNTPEIGKAAVYLLNTLGYFVEVLPWSCCGRPALSKGMLKWARSQAEVLIEKFYPFATQGIPLLGLEPSCILTLKDDYEGLIDQKSSLYFKIQTLANQSFILDAFFAQLVDKGEFNLSFSPHPKIVKVHGHCHQKSLVGMQPTLKVLRAVPSFQVTEIPSGCCGMAGSFGYEKEHYTTSMAMAALTLFPAIQASTVDTLLVANGMSCRHQILDGTQRQAVHLAEALWDHLLK